MASALFEPFNVVSLDRKAIPNTVDGPDSLRFFPIPD